MHSVTRNMKKDERHKELQYTSMKMKTNTLREEIAGIYFCDFAPKLRKAIPRNEPCSG